MYNFNNLEEMLRAGVSADEIAQAFTKNLNTAIDAVKPTPMQEAGEDLAKAWNHMIDLWLEDNDVPSYLDGEDDLYISGDTAFKLFNEAMGLIVKIGPIFDAIAALAEDDGTNPAPVKTETDVNLKNNKRDDFDEFDDTMRSFLRSIGVK
jgi:hypothetical protein